MKLIKLILSGKEKTKMNQKEIKQIIKDWKLSQKIIDLTDKGLIELATKIIEYEVKKRHENS